MWKGANYVDVKNYACDSEIKLSRYDDEYVDGDVKYSV